MYSLPLLTALLLLLVLTLTLASDCDTGEGNNCGIYNGLDDKDHRVCKHLMTKACKAFKVGQPKQEPYKDYYQYAACDYCKFYTTQDHCKAEKEPRNMAMSGPIPDGYEWYYCERQAD